MLLHEISIAGLLFSPLVVFVPISFLLTLATHSLIHRLSLDYWVWRNAWFDASLFCCYLALTVFVLG